MVERRKSDKEVDPGIVCLSRGHVKARESMDEALKREMWEEVGIELKGLKFVCESFYVASNGERQKAFCFLVTEYEGKPVCRSAQEIFWKSNIEKLDLEVDRRTIRKLRELYVKSL